MPFLGGLFSRKNKSSPRSKRDDHAATSSIHASELDSALSSPTTSYVTPDKSIPSYPNARNLLHPVSTDESSSKVYPSMTTLVPPTGRKLRLPFSRKKNALSRSDLSTGSSPNVNSLNFETSPQSVNNGRASTSALVSQTDPEGLRRLRPPPSRSAIFAAYGDPTNSPSTHSLPGEASVASELSFPPSPSPHSSKKTSLLSWSKASASNISPSSPLSNSPSPTSPDPANSFNLKSFRHIRAPSPTRSNASNVSLTTPVARPRPRGESINSESSQRISVAAFREAQARRSLAGSPSPSFRAPSPVPALLAQTSTSTSPVQAGQRQNKVQPRGRQSSMALYTSDSSTSSDDGTEEETIKRRPGISHSELNDYDRKGKGKAKSEMGHKTVEEDRFAPDSAVPQRVSQSHSGHSHSGHSHSGHSGRSSGQMKPGINRNGLDFPPRPQSSLGHYTPAPKMQASVSTMTSSQSTSVKLSGRQVAPTPNSDITGASKPPREAPLSTHLNSQNTLESLNNVPQKYMPASDSESDSEDDAPLATLVGPRSPMSSYSSLYARSTGNVTTRSTRSSTLSPAKPLIDINELTAPKRSFTASPEKSTAGFTQGSTLLSRAMSPTSTENPSPSDLNRPLTRKAPPVKFISPPSSPENQVRHLRPVDGADSTPRSDSITVSLEKSASPEQPRDALTERLSRVVNLNLTPGASNAVGPNIPRVKNSVPSQTGSLNISEGDTSDSSHPLRSEKKDICFPSTKDALRRPSAENPSPAPKTDYTPPDEDLAQLLGTAGIKFMLRNDKITDQSSESESEEEEDSSEEVKREEVTSTENEIAPIPIKQRPPTSSFSVTSRPPLPGRASETAAQAGATRVSNALSVAMPRRRSITLTPSSTSFDKISSKDNGSPSVPSNVPSKSSSSIVPPKLENDALRPPGVRQRSSTIVTGVPLDMQMAKAFHIPERPFAVRRNSPASSTGDSSSGRAPLTPRDGSEIGVEDRKRDQRRGGAGTLGVKHQHVKRRSVSFEENHPDSKPLGITHSKGKEHTSEDQEARRKERRRTEAKAAIELGNVINGPAPIVDDEDEMPINHSIGSRMSTLNPVMGMGLPMPMQMDFRPRNSVAWGGNMVQPMHPSAYLMPPPADPKFLAAHQHAMMYAKQAYQMAVAQQAMAAAGDEWERGSSVGGYAGSGIIGASPSPAMMGPHFGMMPMGQGYGWPSPSSVYLPSSSQSMYGGDGSIGNSRSEYGGIKGPNNWPSSRSSYGESFGPSLNPNGRKNAQTQRNPVYSSRVPVIPAAQSQNGRGSPVPRSGNGQPDSAYLPSMSPMPASQFQSGRGSPDNTPRSRTASQPASPSRSTYGRKAPPSSWKPGV